MPLLTLLGQKSTTHTVGGTSQLSGFSSTGGLNVFTTITVGGTDQLNAFGSTGGLNVFTVHTVGGTDQLSGFTSTGGAQVVSATTAATGGFWFDYEEEADRRRRHRAEREEKRRKAQAIQDKLDRLIALEQRRLEEESARHQELETLTDMVRGYKGSLRKATTERIQFIAKQAINRRTFSAMERLERELFTLSEEETFLMMATMMIINE